MPYKAKMKMLENVYEEKRYFCYAKTLSQLKRHKIATPGISSETSTLFILGS